MRCFKIIFSRRCRRCISASRDTRLSEDASVDYNNNTNYYYNKYYYKYYYIS